MRLTYRFVREERPGPKWAALAERTLPAYRRWYRAGGMGARDDVEACRAALTTHMPELVPLWEELVRRTGSEPLVACLLSGWRPPAYQAGCSQAVWTRGEPMLVRNYDYRPTATEGTILCSAWSGTRVVAASDCLWGALDGLNEHGLAVALAYGGRRVRGVGFGIPLVLRYVLETCRSTREALDVLRRVPSHMAYNVSVVDVEGLHAVAQLGPDQETRVLRSAVATNHQRVLRWPLGSRAAQSLLRERRIEELLADPRLAASEFCDAFLAPPLHSTDHAAGDGTLYTAVYRPRAAAAEYRWPGHRVSQTLDAFEERELVVSLA